jgi:hypothetical protein
MSPPLNVALLKSVMPRPVAAIALDTRLYRLEECPAAVAEYLSAIPAVRWQPPQGVWRRESVAWDARDGLARMRNDRFVFPRPFLDNPLVAVGGRLYFADYHLQRRLPNGAAPRNFACWCLESADRGRSWRNVGLIAHDPAGQRMMTEPSLALTTQGDLVCVIRTSTHVMSPLLLARSKDRGRTWSSPRALHPCGVMPQLLLLANGILVLCFGRPGVHLMFSSDGEAVKWTEPIAVVPGRIDLAKKDSCGYTRLAVLAVDSFLVVYSRFGYVHAEGRPCRAILARRVRATRR